MNNEADFWFTTMYYGLPIFVVFIGLISCEKMAFLGSIAIACIMEIVFDVIFIVVAITDSEPLTTEIIHQKQIVICLLMVSAFILMLINEIPRQQKTHQIKGDES